MVVELLQPVYVFLSAKLRLQVTTAFNGVAARPANANGDAATPARANSLVGPHKPNCFIGAAFTFNVKLIEALY